MEYGLTDLDTILATVEIQRRGNYVYALMDSVPAGLDVLATVNEAEGMTVVVDAGHAAKLGLEASPVFTCLTLNVHSALESVGLTRAVSTVLADAGIPCNIIAGFYHDHLLVPRIHVDRAEQLLHNLVQAHSVR